MISPLYRAFRCVYACKRIIIIILKKITRDSLRPLSITTQTKQTNNRLVTQPVLPPPVFSPLLLPSDLRGFPAASSAPLLLHHHRNRFGAFYFSRRSVHASRVGPLLLPVRLFSSSSIRLEAKPHHGCSLLCARSVNAPPDHTAERKAGMEEEE